ncbi:MAG: 16S rRNA (cytosine(1402)-N(4))-methyltransferase RsmH [Candidatus Yanofskybacteria bacterium]|nr:16S rRNA (cytosine(1402)-N(4))-methyltransferase RsmH [Candidatus Yanofskybacteria bacterium]
MHIPVLRDEVLEVLDPKPGEHFIDCTLGSGGHTKAILEKTAPDGKLLGIEWDPEALEETRGDLTSFQSRVTLIHGNYAFLKEIAEASGFSQVHGILFDLGFSSPQLEERGRGFSFRRNEPLDMRYDPTQLLTAAEILSRRNILELQKILKEYGEERFAKSIAKRITEVREKKRIATTEDLLEVIRSAVPGWYRRDPNMAQRTFQALRIATNAELENLKLALPQAEALLKPGGRVAVISFHSLEDRIAKHFLRNSPNLSVLTKKPITPSLEEIKNNPRSRSAKLRAAKKE